jgi:hypothetical protein
MEAVQALGRTGNESRLSRFSKILSIAVGTLEAQVVAEDR